MWLCQVASPSRWNAPLVTVSALLRICAGIALSCCSLLAQAQLPYLNGGPNSAFAQLDFAQAYLNERIWEANSNDRGDVIDFSGISALDLDAPDKAVHQFNQAASLLRAQNFKEAIKYLQKSIALYPKFVSAHNALGLAYLEDHQEARAKTEFETAASLDAQFPGTFLNLGVLALWDNDFATADSNFEKAAALRPDDPKILTALAFAQNGDHKYAESLQTVERVHALEHRGLASVHYIAAAAAMSLHDSKSTRSELNLLLNEDPANPLSPVARKQLLALAGMPNPPAQPSLPVSPQPDSGSPKLTYTTFPNSERLRAQLEDLKDQPETNDCEPCNAPEPTLIALDTLPPAPKEAAVTDWDGQFTIHQVVDETALFFSVSQRGRVVNDLSISDIRIRDDNKPPEKIVEFIPQSKLPLRLGLLIDTSNSVEKRFAFEKRAAERFIERVLNRDSDLAFVAGFDTEVTVVQDFTADSIALARGIEGLSDGGQTSIFDAVHYACWKLAAYPDEGRVARVLVVLSDGEDNSSHTTLKTTLEAAEAAGVTIYAFSTSEDPASLLEKTAFQTDADRVLRELAERTGGAAIFPHDLRGLDHYLAKLPDVIRNRYLVAYKPAEFSPDGKYRTIAVTAEKDGKRLHVHARKGYYARGISE